MICGICSLHVGACICPDMDDRLHSLAFDPDGVVAFKWCRGCDKHYARCRCEMPKFYVVLAGREWKIPNGGFRNVEGGRTIPNLDKR